MRSNAHTGERRGSWKPENVDGAAKALVEGDMCVFFRVVVRRLLLVDSRPPLLSSFPAFHRRAASWLQKLEVVAGLVGADRSQVRGRS
jgi:hypothetical protein